MVFTVKLPAALAGRVRAYARERETTISAVVARALTEFLSRGRRESPRRRATGRSGRSSSSAVTRPPICRGVWGVGFLLEAALRVAIVYNTWTSTALSLSKVMAYIWAGIFVAWTVAYGRYQKKKGEPMMTAAAAVEGPGTSDPDPQPADITKTAGQA